MNIYSIFIKELKQNLRNKKSMGLMILFPIVLMLVLGTALSGVVDTSGEFKSMSVIYTNTDTQSFGQAFNAFVDKGQETGIKFHEAKNESQGIESIKNDKYSCFIKVTPTGIEFYKNKRFTFQASLVQGILDSFLQRYDAVAAIAKTNPAAIKAVLADNSKPRLVTTSSLKHKKLKSMDYFAVTILTLIIMYSALSASSSIGQERSGKTANRLLSSPLRRHELLIGKMLGVLGVTLLQGMVVLLFSKYLLKTYWGDHLGTVLLIIIAEIMMAVSFGIATMLLIKGNAGNAIINTAIPIIVFLGGGYGPVENFGKTVIAISNVSPIRWVNRSILEVIYASDFSNVGTTLLINFGLAALFIIIATVAIRKEAF